MGQKESQARGRNGLAQDITLQKKLEIAPDMAEAIYIRVVALRTVSLKINIDMKTDSRIMFRMIGEAHKNADLSIEIESTQSRRSNLSFQSRFLALDNSEINIKTLGRLPSEAIGARSFYDSKILQLGAEASVSGSPEMVIENDEVEAGHGFSVGSIPEEKILYLLGRGLNRDEARRLYAKGFLKEIV
jgi:Fe-S cluster assembly scaffold protein SufB